MAEESGTHRGTVDLTPRAEDDRFEIFRWTARRWGMTQADRYDEFLQSAMQALADDPSTALFVPNLKNVRVSIARWNNSRDGHRIFFREVPGGIEVIGIIHTSRNWQDHLDTN